MSKSFLPTSDSTLRTWTMNYRENISEYSQLLGLSTAELNEIKRICDVIINNIDCVATRKAQLKTALNKRSTNVRMKGHDLRKRIEEHKSNPAYSKLIGQALGIASYDKVADLSNYKPHISIELLGNYTYIRFKRIQTDSLVIYKRKKGTQNWILAARITQNVSKNAVVFLNSIQPYNWEYQAQGVVGETEVGFPSDIIELNTMNTPIKSQRVHTT